MLHYTYTCTYCIYKFFSVVVVEKDQFCIVKGFLRTASFAHSVNSLNTYDQNQNDIMSKIRQSKQQIHEFLVYRNKK